MARKDIVKTQLLRQQSLASSFVSPPTIINFLDNCAYQINVVTTDSHGTFDIQASIDYTVDGPTGAVSNPGNWVSLPIGGTPSITGSSDVILVNMNQLPFSAIRVVYTSTVAGTGVCDLFIESKQIGG